ncbi:MAG: LysR family transcriptional regulator [Firmicutes bacterium]|nr:LysR family transcriptional regulator [Bacillota bacterium]
MEINFELYKIFYVVANNRSISKGAEQLLISQPAVTQAIKNLEGQLGTTLFIRTKKGIILTNEGKELYEYVKEGMNYFINGTNKLQELKKMESGILRIGASTSITENFLMPKIKIFHELYPNIEIKIVNQLTDVLLQELRNGNLDVVVGSESFKDNKDLEFSYLCDIEYTFVSKDKLNLDVQNIFKKNVIIQTLPSVSRSIFEQLKNNNVISFDKELEVVSHRLVTELVKSDLGIGFVVKDYVLKDLLNGELYEVDILNNLPKRRIGYTIKKNFTPSYAVKSFLEIIKR